MVVKEKFYVGYSEANREFLLSNEAILRIFENMACIHGASVGDSIKTSDGRWFLTGYHVKVLKRPELEERITVHTWSRDIKGVSAYREFEIYNEKGELAVIGLSNWARVNAKTQRLEKPSAETVAAYQSEPERTNFGKPSLPKLKECENYTLEKNFYVERNLIDANNHMNNVHYLGVAGIIMPEEVYGKKECDEFEIMYRQALKYGETVKCFYGETEDSHIVTLKTSNLETVSAIIKMYN